MTDRRPIVLSFGCGGPTRRNRWSAFAQELCSTCEVATYGQAQRDAWTQSAREFNRPDVIRARRKRG